MKVVILAGGYGSRISEKTTECPKPMIEIGGLPMLCHIMNIYSAYGFNEFIIALGYKGHVIKNYFLNFYSLNSDFSVDLRSGKKTKYTKKVSNWIVHLIDTGLDTQTGGRIKRLKAIIGNETFMLTYGDGLSNVNIEKLVEFHKYHGKLATITAVRPPARFGGLSFCGDCVSTFSEKARTETGWINGGFFVLDPTVLDYIDGDDVPWERDPLEKLASSKNLMAFKHEGFWQPMDTLREHNLLEAMWADGNPPWVIKKIEIKQNNFEKVKG